MRLRLPPVRAFLRTPMVINIALGVLALTGAVVSVQLVTASSTTTPTTGAGASRTVAVTQGPVVSTVSASGTVQSATTAAADFATAGTVTSIAVKVGDTVAKDQALATVDPTDAQAQLDTARANLTAAQASLTRARSGGDDATIATAQAQVTSARAAVDEANRGVAGTTLKAPMAGTVTAVNGSVGASSGSGSGSGSGQAQGQGSATTTSTSGFIQLADLTAMQVSASFAEADATKLKTGQAGTVTWAALTGTTAAATIATIAPTATTANGVNSYAVTVALTETPAGVRIGQTVTVQVTVAQVENAIRIPSAAVRSVGTRHTVSVLVGAATQTRAVEIGIVGDTFTQVTSGLTVGEQVAIVVATTTAGTNGNQFPGGGFGGGGLGGGVGGAGTGGRGGTGR